MNNDTYIKAFNQSYLLAKYDSSLIERILSYQNEGPYFEGLVDGKSTFNNERLQSRNRDLQRLRSNKDKGKGLEL